MIWALLALLGVPLWLCALGLLGVILENRKLRKRGGDIPVRVRHAGGKRWTRGHAIWVSDVFAWRGSPASWKEELVQATGATPRAADPEEQKRLHRLAADPPIVNLALTSGETLDVACTPERLLELLGPFAASADHTRSAPA